MAGPRQQHGRAAGCDAGIPGGVLPRPSRRPWRCWSSPDLAWGSLSGSQSSSCTGYHELMLPLYASLFWTVTLPLLHPRGADAAAQRAESQPLRRHVAFTHRGRRPPERFGWRASSIRWSSMAAAPAVTWSDMSGFSSSARTVRLVPAVLGRWSRHSSRPLTVAASAEGVTRRSGGVSAHDSPAAGTAWARGGRGAGCWLSFRSAASSTTRATCASDT